MTEDDLIRIMGKPAYTEILYSGDENSAFPWDQKYLKDIIREYGQVVLYGFGKRKFGQGYVDTVEGIYLDRGHSKIIGLRVRSMHWDLLRTSAILEGIALFAVCITLPWISLKIACDRLKKK